MRGMSSRRSISLQQYNCAEIKQVLLSNYSHIADFFIYKNAIQSLRVLMLLNLIFVQKQLQNVLFKQHCQHFSAGVTFILKVFFLWYFSLHFQTRHTLYLWLHRYQWEKVSKTPMRGFCPHVLHKYVTGTSKNEIFLLGDLL